MATYRDRLPQLEGGVFLTDSGLETDLIFNKGYELPLFAAFTLLADDSGADELRRYFRDHVAVADDAGAGFVLESVTWRANPQWGEQLGYTPEALASANEQAVVMLADLRRELGEASGPLVVSGCIGPRGDGYTPGAAMEVDEAEAYHAVQVATFAATEAHLVHAMTITTPAEAAGIVRAATAAGIPELDVAEELDAGDPVALGDDYRRLRERLPGLNVLGGCCGTDVRHVRAVASACLAR